MIRLVKFCTWSWAVLIYTPVHGNLLRQSRDGSIPTNRQSGETGSRANKHLQHLSPVEFYSLTWKKNCLRGDTSTRLVATAVAIHGLSARLMAAKRQWCNSWGSWRGRIHAWTVKATQITTPLAKAWRSPQMLHFSDFTCHVLRLCFIGWRNKFSGLSLVVTPRILIADSESHGRR